MSWTEHLHSANWNEACGIFLCAYALGCLTIGYYLVRWLEHKDIREIGSGSVGARNVSRVLGKTGFTLTVLGDFGKGMLAVWMARQFTVDDRIVVVAILGVVAGHIWPLQLRFHGGKGMATSLGALLVYDPHLAVAFTILFVGLLLLFRKTILPGLVALAAVPLVSFWLSHNPPRAVLLSFLAALVLIAHWKNIVEEISQFAPRRQEQTESDQTTL